MILSRARRFIFIHIPKTGGTALTLALEAQAAKDDILISDTPKPARARAGLLGSRRGGVCGNTQPYSTLPVWPRMGKSPPSSH